LVTVKATVLSTRSRFRVEREIASPNTYGLLRLQNNKDRTLSLLSTTLSQSHRHDSADTRKSPRKQRETIKHGKQNLTVSKCNLLLSTSGCQVVKYPPLGSHYGTDSSLAHIASKMSEKDDSKDPNSNDNWATYLANLEKEISRISWMSGRAAEVRSAGETTVEETYDRTFIVTSRVRFSVSKEDDGAPVDCVIDHPAVKDLLAQRHLEVMYKPEVKIVVTYPEGLTREGDNLDLTCIAEGKPHPHQINWLRVDEDVPPHAVVTGSDLYIENLNKSYNGTYRCVAFNTVGEAYDDYILYVYDAPTTIPTPTTNPVNTQDSRAGEGAPQKIDHAVIGGVVAVVMFAILCALIVLGRYFARHKGTYFTHEAKGADDAADADTAIINAEGGHNNTDEKKEYYI
ncbi:cell adhesion molecule 1-like isoform X1, partial [Solea senegalensis]